jgi:Ca2+-binding RTX toxin-like protein
MLTGGLDQDTFVFNQKLLKSNIDKITDFNAADDTIQLGRTVFKKLTTGALAEENLIIGSKAKEKDDHIIYNAKKGTLAYDADGKGGNDAIVFAEIGKKLALTADDFLVV